MRAHLRLSGYDEDSVVAAAISAAVNLIEEETRRALITQTWRASISCEWAENDRIWLPRPRLIAITSVEYWNSVDAWVEHDVANYRVASDSEPAGLWLTDTPADLGTSDFEDSSLWRVTYTAGYGPTPNEVPDALRAAIKLLAAHLFENREAMVIGNTVAMALPIGIDRLIAPFRVPWGGTNL